MTIPSIIFSFLLSVQLHPLHVSVTEINFDEKDRALEVMMRVFADDLETALRKHTGQKDLDVLNLEKEMFNPMVASYLQLHFGISLDGKEQKVRYLGNELEGDAFIFYIEVEKVRKWKNISVRNSVLTDTFGDQSNMVHVTAQNTVRTLRLNKDNPRGQITF